MIYVTGNIMKYQNRNDSYIQKNLRRLMSRHGGQWVVVAGGRLIGVGPKRLMRRYFEAARKRYPKETPLVSSIPTPEQVHCILSNSITKK